MDFDLFEVEDDDIFSSLCIAPTQPDLASNPIPEFNCTGEDSTNVQFSTDSFVKNLFALNQKNAAIDEISLSSYGFQHASLQTTLVLNCVVGEVRMSIQNLMASLKNPIETDDGLSYYQRRRQVTLFYHLILAKNSEMHWSLVEQHLSSLRHLLNRITSKDVLKLIYIANSSKGNETNTSAYHFLHGCLEWKLLDLFILQQTRLELSAESNNEAKSSLFDTQLERIFDDLTICSIFLYKKKKTTELLFSSPFPCTCIKETWLVLQISIEKWQGENFWKLFNRTLDKFKSKSDEFGLTPQSFAEFTIWMIKALMRLQGYRSNGVFEGPHYPRVTENYEQLENTVQIFFSSNPNEEQTRIFICMLMPIVLEWWKPKVNIPMILWEHFHKKLNSSFFVSGSAPSNLAVSSISGKGYLDKSRSLLNQCVPDANLSSFSLFTIVIGKTIERLNQIEQTNQTQKLLGRIYSKFSLAKFLALNETGIHHLNELFLSLALSGDFNDIAPKLREKLLSISLDKVVANRQIAVAKGHIALLILFSEKQCNISEYASKLLQQLGSIRNDVAVSKIIADGLLDIFKNAQDFDKGENVLIDSWIPNFLNACTPAEQERSLEALHLIFDKIKKNSHLISGRDRLCHIQALIKSLNAHILPYVKQNFMTSFSPWIPRLAAEFCILATTNEQGGFLKNYKFFIDAATSNRQAVPKFLLTILESEKSNLVDSSTIVQVWLRSLIQLSANNEDVVNLTGIVSRLEEFHYVTDIIDSESLKSKEPLCVFVSAVGKCFDSCTDPNRKRAISDKFNAYLNSFEKWVPDKNEKSEVMFRFYSFIAIVVYNCANIVYARSKITCFFHVALTRFILPTTIQMGKPPEGKLDHVIHKVWPVLAQGIGRLNFRSDPYITKTLNDLVAKWTPHFKISPNSKIVARPFVACLKGDNESLSLFVFEKLTSLFLATQRRQADPNACLVITIFQEVVDAVEDDESRMLVVLKASCLTVLEHTMMVDEIIPSHGLMLDLLRKIVKSSAFEKSVAMRSLIAEHMRIIAKRHLAYYTFFYFELLMKIVNICCPLVEDVMEYLLEEIAVVEAKRGGGEDNRIRTCVEKLKGAIVAANKR
ncbi:protein MMS22-like [Episyrphus balteatus]|uniref:protein MMS22-like n=1 Tax=Episyrphus balteatus TaxID=286459 RepID=UPI00248576F6|nr:protein MMS22-like [Episyrphus balteatus]